ncbi:hypothetical protein GLV98_13940 [Halobacillus litoralis]|uniref:Uncharacterized protein n=1 Tax=Halobacillus litoralis TaxID=45668 RepID=A0A845E4K7_9BACI|nr:hypothetical protein [Halobacillus litoralis]MYL50595.1 hypothetical protein [Halobacillus litoralis]
MEEQADSNYFIHEVSINKKNLLKTMRELYTEHNIQVKHNKSLEETVESLKQQLKEREQNLKQLPTETVIKQHFSDIETRAVALEEKLEEKYKNQSPILASLQKQMKQMDGELKQVKGSLEELSDSESSNEVKVEQINTATKNLQQWTRSIDEKIQSLLKDQSEEAKKVDELFQRVTDSDREVKEVLEKVHNYLDAQPDVQKQFDQIEKRLDEMKQNMSDIENKDVSVLTERLEKLEASFDQDKSLQLDEKIVSLTARLENINQKIKPNQTDNDVSNLDHQLNETDKKVAFILEFLEKYTEYQNELPRELQQSMDEIIEKMKRLEEVVQSTQEDVEQIKEEKETPATITEEGKEIVFEEEPESKENDTNDIPSYEKNVEEEPQTMHVDQDSWFYHSLKNLSETQESFRPISNPVHKRRKKKKTEKHTDLNKQSQKEQSYSDPEDNDETPPSKNDVAPKPSSADTPLHVNKKSGNKVPDISKETPDARKDVPLENETPTELDLDKFSSQEEKQIPDIQKFKEVESVEPSVEKYEPLKDEEEEKDVPNERGDLTEEDVKEPELGINKKYTKEKEIFTKEESLDQQSINDVSSSEETVEQDSSNKKTLMENIMKIFSMT